MKKIASRDLSSNHVKSYKIYQYDSGVIQLLIVTVDKWVKYHRSNNTTYEIGPFDEGNIPEYTLMVPEIPKKVIEGYYLPTQFQEKDEISFYFIPYKLIG